MQRLLFGLAIAGLTLMAPAWAHAGDQASAAKSADQQLADQVKSNLSSGQLHHFSIDVKVADGTCWLRGSVSNQQQLTHGSEHRLGNPGNRKGRQRPEDDRPEPGRASVGRPGCRCVGSIGGRHSLE